MFENQLMGNYLFLIRRDFLKRFYKRPDLIRAKLENLTSCPNSLSSSEMKFSREKESKFSLSSQCTL